jgi:hypothetical protein
MMEMVAFLWVFVSVLSPLMGVETVDCSTSEKSKEGMGRVSHIFPRPSGPHRPSTQKRERFGYSRCQSLKTILRRKWTPNMILVGISSRASNIPAHI